jgi:hypothetical protein
VSFRWNIAWNILRLRSDSLGSRARWVIAYICSGFAFRFGEVCLNTFIRLRLSLHCESLGSRGHGRMAVFALTQMFIQLVPRIWFPASDHCCLHDVVVFSLFHGAVDTQVISVVFSHSFYSCPFIIIIQNCEFGRNILSSTFTIVNVLLYRLIQKLVPTCTFG